MSEAATHHGVETSISESSRTVTRQAAGKRFRVPGWVSAALTFVVLVVLWELYVIVFSPATYTLPSPISVLKAMFSHWSVYGPAIKSTAGSVAAGFVLALVVSLVVAALTTYSRFIRNTVYPLVVAAQLVPKVALAPLFIVWFGFGSMSKVTLVVLIAFFPIVVDATVGFASVKPETLMLLRSMGANRRQAFLKARLPTALPNILAGCKVGVTLAVVGAVVAEFVGSNSGLGSVLSSAQGSLDTTSIFAAMAWLTLIGVVYYLVVVLVERVLLSHRKRLGMSELAGHL